MKYPNIIYQFHEHNATFHRVPDPEPYKNLPDVAINPNLAGVCRHTHHWKLVNGEVVMKSDEEIEATDAYHDKTIVRNPESIVIKEYVDREKIVEKIVKVPCIREVEVEVTRYVDRVEYRYYTWTLWACGILTAILGYGIFRGA